METFPLITCLIADDDPDDQEIFSIALEDVDKSCECIFAGNGVEALEKLSALESPPDYIFLDLNMPRLNGIQCLAEIKKCPVLSQVPVVIYSTSSEQFFIDQAMSAGASAFVTKPASISELVKILNGLFSHCVNS